jgi:hypothetical protein
METGTWCVLLGAAAGFLKEAKLDRFGALIHSFGWRSFLPRGGTEDVD